MGDRADGRITGATKFGKFTYEANILNLQSVPPYVGSQDLDMNLENVLKNIGTENTICFSG